MFAFSPTRLPEALSLRRLITPGGTVLPGADVTIENFATHERRVAQACGSDYVIDRFPPDDYSIKISSRGFITANGTPRECQVALKLLF